MDLTPVDWERTRRVALVTSALAHLGRDACGRARDPLLARLGRESAIALDASRRHVGFHRDSDCALGLRQRSRGDQPRFPVRGDRIGTRAALVPLCDGRHFDPRRRDQRHVLPLAAGPLGPPAPGDAHTRRSRASWLATTAATRNGGEGRCSAFTSA
jgi:hypothetical protein